MIILKFTLNALGVRKWIAFIWLRMEPMADSYKCDKNLLVPKKAGIFLTSLASISLSRSILLHGMYLYSKKLLVGWLAG
jgi:hypothetical protein